jgi:hypothetical protein
MHTPEEGRTGSKARLLNIIGRSRCMTGIGLVTFIALTLSGRPSLDPISLIWYAYAYTYMVYYRYSYNNIM